MRAQDLPALQSIQSIKSEIGNHGGQIHVAKSDTPGSVMDGTLNPGTVNRTLTTADLNIPQDTSGADAQHAALPPEGVPAMAPGSPRHARPRPASWQQTVRNWLDYWWLASVFSNTAETRTKAANPGRNSSLPGYFFSGLPTRMNIRWIR